MPLDESERESEKTGLKLNIQKPKVMASSPIIPWQIDGDTMETVTDFIFLGSKITADGDCSRKWSNWQTTNLENIQATPTAQLQKNKWPNQKMGQRTK